MNARLSNNDICKISKKNTTIEINERKIMNIVKRGKAHCYEVVDKKLNTKKRTFQKSKKKNSNTLPQGVLEIFKWIEDEVRSNIHISSYDAI